MSNPVIIPSMGGGEYAPNMYSRVDLARYSIGLRRCRNFIIHPQGGASNRAGTYYVANTKNSSDRTRVVKFIFSKTQAYVLEFGDKYIRFFTNDLPIMNGSVPYEVVSPYSETELSALNLESSADTIFITHPNHQTRLLARYGNADWRFSLYEPVDGPFMQWNLDLEATLNVSSVTGSGVTLISSVLDTNTVLLLHMDGDDSGVSFIDDTGKAVTNTGTIDTYTKLLLHMDGVNNGTTFTDEIGKAVTRVGAPVTKIDIKKFGSASGYFNGTTDYLRLADSADWAFGSGDFTIDCWVRFNSLSKSFYPVFSQGTDTTTTFNYVLFGWGRSGSLLSFTCFSAGTPLARYSAFWEPAVNTWYHLAVVRNGTSLKMFVDGTELSATVTTPIASSSLPDYASVMAIGQLTPVVSGYAAFFDGHIDEYRLSKGIARWTANFTPPAYQYNQTKITTKQSVIGGASALFEGDSWLSLADSADWNFGTGNFTISFWYRPSSLTGLHMFYDQSTNGDNCVLFYKDTAANDNKINFIGRSGAAYVAQYVMTGAWAAAVDTWYHVEICRAGAVMQLFIDGVEEALTESTAIGTLPDLAATVKIGGSALSTSYYLNGYLDEYIVSKGIALHTAAFTPSVEHYDLSGLFYEEHVGSLWKLRHFVEGQHVTAAFGSATASTSIKCFTTWRIITHGTWTGTLKIEISTDNGTTWKNLRTYSSANDLNINTFGTEDIEVYTEPFLIRMNMSAYTSGACNADLSSDPFYQEGVIEITDYVSAQRLEGTVLSDFAAITGTIDWAEGSWSNHRGWPAVARFIEDRLAFSSTYSEPMTTWMTQTGNYYSFFRHSTLIPSDGITVNLPARQLNAINGLVALRKLVALTSSSEWTVGAVSGEVLGPTTIRQEVQGYRGSSGIEPELIGNECIFCQANGMVIRNLSYQFSDDAFVGSDLNVLARHLFKNHSIVEMAYQQDPDSILWCLRDDGVLLGLTYMKEQEVIAWHWHDTEGTVESICCIPADGYDELWMIVNRANGRFVEYMAPRMVANVAGVVVLADQCFLDSAKKFLTGESITGLTHLEGEDVQIVEGGIPLGLETVISGSVSVTVATATTFVGLPYTPQIETLNVEAQTREGTMQSRKIKIGSVTLRVIDTRGGKVGPDEDNLHETIDDAIDAEGVTLPTSLYSGDIRVVLGGGYEDGGRVFYEQDQPLPVTITAFIPEVSPGGASG